MTDWQKPPLQYKIWFNYFKPKYLYKLASDNNCNKKWSH